MRTIGVALAALVTVLALAGCDDGKDPSDPQATWTPTGKMETPTSDATASAPTQPERPAGADVADKAGARAFVAYYWAVVDYATATGDVSGLDALAGPDCSGCRGGSASIRQVYDEGGTIESSGYRVHSTRLRALDLSTGDRAYVATVGITNEHQVIRIPGKADNNTGLVAETYTFTLLHVGSGWRVETLAVA